MTTPRLKKSLGQHFLHDKNISHKIVQLLGIMPDDQVMEIGPGAGALSDYLMQEKLKQLVFIEKDTFWAKKLQARINNNDFTQTVLIDALHMPWHKVSSENPWKIISNLPYNVASPLMWDIFSKCSGLIKAVFMMQKEVGLRLVAKPGNKDYGALSVWIQSFVRPQWGFTVAPKSFRPPPKVDSAVLSFIPLSADEKAKHPEELSKLIKICFQSRRKQLKSIFRNNNLLHLLPILKILDIDEQYRPENLSPQDFANIVDKLVE